MGKEDMKKREYWMLGLLKELWNNDLNICGWGRMVEM